MNVKHSLNRTVASGSTDQTERVEISAFVDGELDDADVERVIDALLASDDLADFWADAHRAGDWMRSDEVIGVGDGHSFLRRFSSRLASEPSIVAIPKRGRSRSRRFWISTGLPGASVAAALVVVAWVATPFGNGDDKGGSAAAPAVPTVAIVQVAKSEEGAVKETGWKVVDPDRFSDYLAAHRDVTPFAYRGPGVRQASFNITAPASNDAPTSP